MSKRKTKTKQVEQDQGKREAILDERGSLKRLFPATYSPDIGVFNDGKVEVMFKLTISQAKDCEGYRNQKHEHDRQESKHGIHVCAHTHEAEKSKPSPK